MSYLLEEDYSKIIEKAITTNTEKVGYFFHSEYIRVKESNFDFIECLTKTINELEIRYNEEKEKLIVKESDKEIRLKGYCETDFRDTTDWNETIFWYHNGKVFFEFNFYWKENQYLQFKLSTLNKLITGLDKFKELINDNVIDEKKINEIDSVKKLKWKGTPAQFCYIIDLLINKGYLEQPTPKGERSGKVLLSHFEFENDNPTFQSLGRNLHKNFDSIKSIEHRKLFQKIPHRNELDK